MGRSSQAVCSITLSGVLLVSAGVLPAAAAEAWRYRDCPSSQDVGAGSARSGGSVTYHAYYQNDRLYHIVRSYGSIMLSRSELNYSDIHFVTDGSSFSSIRTACA